MGMNDYHVARDELLRRLYRTRKRFQSLYFRYTILLWSRRRGLYTIRKENMSPETWRRYLRLKREKEKLENAWLKIVDLQVIAQTQVGDHGCRVLGMRPRFGPLVTDCCTNADEL